MSDKIEKERTIKFYTNYNRPKTVHHKFEGESLTDKTAYTPLSVIINRAEQSGQLRSGLLRGVYDFKDDKFVDIAKVETCPYYEPDLAEGQSIYEAYKQRFDEKLAKIKSASNSPKVEEVPKAETEKVEV